MTDDRSKDVELANLRAWNELALTLEDCPRWLHDYARDQLALLDLLDATLREVVDLRAVIGRFDRESEQLQSKLDAVRLAHPCEPVEHDVGHYCSTCGDEWPCATVQVVDHE